LCPPLLYALELWNSGVWRENGKRGSGMKRTEYHDDVPPPWMMGEPGPERL
jgi:hypothetical protein